MKSLRCTVDLFCIGATENAHIVGGGTSRKADAEKIIPLCTRHHEIFHQYGSRSFASYYGLNLTAEARRTERRWQSHIESLQEKRSA